MVAFFRTVNQLAADWHIVAFGRIKTFVYGNNDPLNQLQTRERFAIFFINESIILAGFKRQRINFVYYIFMGQAGRCIIQIMIDSEREEVHC
jgi:hypothetical protein